MKEKGMRMIEYCTKEQLAPLMYHVFSHRTPEDLELLTKKDWVKMLGEENISKVRVDVVTRKNWRKRRCKQ